LLRINLSSGFKTTSYKETKISISDKAPPICASPVSKARARVCFLNSFAFSSRRILMIER